MAINPSYDHATTISKVKIGENIYYLKDLDLRAIVNAFGNATAQDVADSIRDGGTGLVTSDQVYDFVLGQIGSVGNVLKLLDATDHTAVADPETGNFVVETDGKEWLYDGTAWREIGDETAYVLKSAKVAGIDLQDDITVAELQTALGLKALAYAATASVTVSDYATGITGASYTPEGDVAVTLNQTATNATLTKGDYTPEGSVSGTVVPTGTVGIAKDNSGTQISGSNAASAVTITPSTASFISGVKDAAVAPSFTEGTFTAATLSHTENSFATEGVVATIDETDAEMLVLTEAGTGTASNITAFDGGSKAADTFNAGSAATFNTANAWTGYTAAEAAAQEFTGDKFKATFTGNASGDAINASFTGTTATDALVTGVSYDKASVDDASFSGTNATITPTLNKGEKKITVSPDTVS